MHPCVSKRLLRGFCWPPTPPPTHRLIDGSGRQRSLHRHRASHGDGLRGASSSSGRRRRRGRGGCRCGLRRCRAGGSGVTVGRRRHARAAAGGPGRTVGHHGGDQAARAAQGRATPCGAATGHASWRGTAALESRGREEELSAAAAGRRFGSWLERLHPRGVRRVIAAAPVHAAPWLPLGAAEQAPSATAAPLDRLGEGSRHTDLTDARVSSPGRQPPLRPVQRRSACSPGLLQAGHARRTYRQGQPAALGGQHGWRLLESANCCVDEGAARWAALRKRMGFDRSGHFLPALSLAARHSST